jgi:hypothetical protein
MDELQKEYEKAFTQGFTSEQLKKNLDRAIKGDFQDDWQRDLDERKKAYRASGMGIDFNTPIDHDKYTQELANRMEKKWTPSKDVDGVYLPSAYGVDIEAEHVFQQELHGIVDDMKVNLVDEKKILEGTLNPEYGKNEWTLPHIERTIHENELSNFNPAEQQWKSDSQNGSLTTDPTLTSTSDSSSSSAFAELFNQNCPIAPLRIQSTRSRTSSCSGKLDASGNETDAMNESSECTVPMISAPMLGMPNEVK